MSKYHSKKFMFDGYTFDSIRESETYLVRKMQNRAGDITNLVVHPTFVVLDGFIYNGRQERQVKYEADFGYDQDGFAVVEDVKGFKTEVYRIKRKLFLSRYGREYKFIET